MNDRFRNLRKIEFTVTLACTGKCRHCSEGDHEGSAGHIDADAAVEAIKKICAHYGVKLSRLTRIAIGELSLRGIPSGKWRPLTDAELAYLKSV